MMGGIPGSSAGRKNSLRHELDDFTADVRQHMRSIVRHKTASLMPEQLARHAFFQRMECPVNTDHANVKHLGSGVQASTVHVCKKDFKFAECDLFRDLAAH